MEQSKKKEKPKSTTKRVLVYLGLYSASLVGISYGMPTFLDSMEIDNNEVAMIDKFNNEKSISDDTRSLIGRAKLDGKITRGEAIEIYDAALVDFKALRDELDAKLAADMKGAAEDLVRAREIDLQMANDRVIDEELSSEAAIQEALNMMEKDDGS